MPNAGAMVMSSVKERPIIFTHNIEKLLDGRKTQTRRIVKPQLDSEPRPPHSPWHSGGDGIWRFCRGAASVSWSDDDRRCQFGVTGDRLWVREAWCTPMIFNDTKPSDLPRALAIGYRAEYDETSAKTVARWRSPMFMPRWASRVILEIVDVRVERIQDISEEDAKAEGVECPAVPQYPEQCGCFAQDDAVENRWHFAHLWNSIHGAGAWAANAWVWALTFKRVQ